MLGVSDARPDDMRKQLSIEAIYPELYVLLRGTMHSERLAALCQSRMARRPRVRGTNRRGQIPHMTSMVEGSVKVATRTVPGQGKAPASQKPVMARPSVTLVERKTRLVLSGQDGLDGCADCPRGHYKNSGRCPLLLQNTQTDDRGKEMAEHWAQRLAIRIFFADP